MPITWKNIQAPDFSGAADMFSNARASFRDMTSGFQKMIADRNALEQQNINTLRENNANDFKDYLASFRTPEELAAAQASGAIQQRLAGFNGAIDRSLARTGADDRVVALRDQFMKQTDYDNTLRDLREAPEIDRGYEVAQLGDLAKLREFDAQNKFRNDGKVMEDLYNISRGIIQNGADNQYRQEGLNIRKADLGLRQKEAKARMDALQRELDYRNELRAGQQDALRTAAQAEQDRATIENTALRKFAVDNNLPTLQDGSIDVSKLSPTQKTELVPKLEALKTSLRDQGLTDSQYVNGKFTTWANKPNSLLSGQDILGLRQLADGSFVSNRELASTDKTASEAQKKANEDAMATNIFYSSMGKNPLETANKIIKDNEWKTEDNGTILFGETDDDERQTSIQEINDIVANGVMVYGEQMPVPPAIIELAMKGIRGGTLEWDGSLERNVRELMESYVPKMNNFTESELKKVQKENLKGAVQPIAGLGYGSFQYGKNPYVTPPTVSAQERINAFRGSSLYKQYQEAKQAYDYKQSADSLALGKYNPRQSPIESFKRSLYPVR